MSKFKIGDKVQILKSEYKEYGGEPMTIPDYIMYANEGKVYQVIDIDERGNDVVILDNYLPYHSSYLVLVDDHEEDLSVPNNPNVELPHNFPHVDSESLTMEDVYSALDDIVQEIDQQKVSTRDQLIIQLIEERDKLIDTIKFLVKENLDIERCVNDIQCRSKDARKKAMEVLNRHTI